MNFDFLPKVHRAMQERGQDPFVASKLERLLSEAQFQDVQQQVRVIQFGMSYHASHVLYV